jgi:hypothetical protein
MKLVYDITTITQNDRSSVNSTSAVAKLFSSEASFHTNLVVQKNLISYRFNFAFYMRSDGEQNNTEDHGKPFSGPKLAPRYSLSVNILIR